MGAKRFLDAIAQQQGGAPVGMHAASPEWRGLSIHDIPYAAPGLTRQCWIEPCTTCMRRVQTAVTCDDHLRSRSRRMARRLVLAQDRFAPRSGGSYCCRP